MDEKEQVNEFLDESKKKYRRTLKLPEQLEYITITKGQLIDLLVHFSVHTMPRKASDVTFQEMDDFLQKWIKERLPNGN